MRCLVSHQTKKKNVMSGQCLSFRMYVSMSTSICSFLCIIYFLMQINSQLGDSYFLISDPDSAGSPPRRVPPPISVKRGGNSVSLLSSLNDPTIAENVATPRNDYGLNKATPTAPMMPTVVSGISPLGLPSLKTGLSDDDLRESAYELLVASMLFSWVEVNPVEDRKKEKSSKFLSGLKSKKDKLHLQSQSSEKHSKLFDIVRVQMQISEAMGACTKRNLIQLAARRSCGQVDLPQISLGLLFGTFKSDFLNEKSYMQWKSRQVKINF
ncbi:hypothetical protein Patl1_18703 [Pistacia atlantica]|uniref:Uncharacterized protein n=1 Tax=Pistacia atlantica TaxID=434234 RepID=A0ACC1BZ39_9ROSI|nr:hypothetical protein Patl1_18703 [Pistacia atlantica]